MKRYRPDRVWTGSQTLTHTDVVVDGSRIVEVSARQETLSEHEELVPLPGQTLLPGLIDSHVHLGFDTRADPATGERETPAAHSALRMAENARKLLTAGVTTARDLGAPDFLDVTLREAIAAGLAVGPNLLVATRPLTPTGGHCWYLGGQADTPEQLRAVAQQNLSAGADWLKVMASGGQMTPDGPPSWQSQYTTADIAVVVAEAHAQGKRCAAHAHSPQAIRAAVAAGVDTIEHCSFQTADGAEYDPRLAESIAQAGITVCPTVSGLSWRLRDVLGAAAMDARLERLRRLRESGVRLMAGTDCGFSFRGFDNAADLFVTSLEVLAHAGFGNAEVLRMATVDAAAGCGVAETTGTVEAGKRADLIAVDADPLHDLTALRQPRLVLVNGRHVTQSQIDTIASSSGVVS